MNVRRAGRSGLLIECADGAAAEAWRAELWRRREAGELPATEIVPGARTVLLDGLVDPDAAAAAVAAWAPPPAAGSAPERAVEVPVTFDGDDLPAVAGLWNLSGPEAARRLCAVDFRVAFCGFAPGFAYLAGLPPELAVPRLESPRPRVPAGSVGLGGEYAGIYPTPSPGGWRLVGRTELSLFDLDREPPALLVPGTRVRLVAA